MSPTLAASVRPFPLGPRIAPWLVGILVLVVYFLGARWHVLHGGQNTDEGFYAVATRAVAQGEMPYRDFGFTQPPLVLYANALPLRVVGFGLFAQRAVNGAWAALALLLAAGWLARRTSVAWGLLLALAFALAAPWMYFNHLGKTYGFTTLLAMLAAWVFLARPAGAKRNFLLALLAAFGVATRLPALPFFGVLWLFALWPRRAPTARELAAALGGLALGSAIAWLPFWLAAPEALKFWVFDFHRISVPKKPWHLAWTEIATLAPAVWLLTGFALAALLARGRWPTRETAVLLAALAALAINLLPAGVYDEYGTPFLLPLAAASAALVSDALSTHARATLLAVVLLVALAAAQFLPAPLLLNRHRPERRGTASQWLTPKTPPYQRDLPLQLAAARRAVSTLLAADAPFVGPDLILAVESGRRVPPELRMGAFAFTAELPPAEAARLHLATRAQLDAWFSDPAVTALALFKRDELNYNWSVPSFTPVPLEQRRATLARLQREFAITYDDGDFFVLVRRDPAR